MISKTHEKFCATLNYIEHFLILGSTITGCVFISDFASLVGIPIPIMSSAIGLKSYAITAAIKKLINSIIIYIYIYIKYIIHCKIKRDNHKIPNIVRFLGTKQTLKK